MKMRGLHGQMGEARAEVEIEVSREGEGIVLLASYDSNVYSSEAVKRMVGRLEHLLEEAGKDTNQAIGKLEMMSQEEREEVLRMSRGGRVEAEGEMIDEVIDRQAS